MIHFAAQLAHCRDGGRAAARRVVGFPRDNNGWARPNKSTAVEANESLRLWPVAPGYFRQAKHDTTLDNGRYPFAAGDWVFGTGARACMPVCPLSVDVAT